MAEEIETTPGKKRRIIHWNPDAGREQAARQWTWKRFVAWSVGGFFGLLIAAGIVIRVAKLVLGPDIFKPRAELSASSPSASDQNTAFITQAKAEQAHDFAAKSLVNLRRMPQDPPRQLEQMILIEKSFNDAQLLLPSQD